MATKGSGEFCSHCSAELIKDARFCSSCGEAVSFRKKISGLSKRLIHGAQNSLDTLKSNLDSQLTDYIRKFENNEPVSIGSLKIPETRRKGVESAMKSFQNKYLGGHPEQTTEYQQWLDELPNRLEDHKCIVCFTPWSLSDQDDIVVCPHCSTGGHRSHIENWIKSKQYCPLCRENVRFVDFIKIV